MTSYEICEQYYKDASINVQKMIAEKCPPEFLSKFVYSDKNQIGWALRMIAAGRCSIELLDAFVGDPDSDVRAIAIERLLDYTMMIEALGESK
jgi:hypothetical protein